MKFNFMKSKIFVVLSILLFVEILFCITGCKDLFISQNAAKTSININLDLSKLIKTSRNQTSQEVTDYLLKIEAYNAENYQENAEVENLPLLTQAKSKVDVSGLVKVTLEVPIDSNVILVAKLHKIIDENTESEKPLYKGKSEIFKVKESDNKIHLVLTKTNSDLDIDISLNTQSTYKVEHYQQNIEDDNYTLVESDSENKTGTIGTNTEAVAKSYEGFSVNPFEQKPILADGSTTVKIYYTRNVYTVTFNANGGSLKDDTSQKVKYGETPAEPTPPEKEGYNFGYWYTSKDNGVTEDVSYNFLTPVTNDVTLYAMWIAGSDIVYKVEHYKQNIEDDNYTLVESDSENKTGTIGTNTEAVAKSYEGFSVNPFEQKTILSNGSTTVKIYYTRNVYTVTFNANGGSLKDDASQKVKYDETPAEPTPPEKEGYNFGYWYTSKDNGVTEDVSYNFSTTVTNDVTLYAMWIAGSDIVYKVEHYQQNIEDDNYTLVESDSENKTGTIGTNTEAVAKSYEGFSVNPFDQQKIFSDGSTTVKIYYTRNVYTVTFNANGGSLKDDASQKVKYGETPAEPTPPEKEGYNFGYWYTSKDNGVTEDVSYNFSTTVTNDVTLYAMWIAGSDIVYKVEHYQQNIEDDNYTLVESDSENKTGTIGTNTEAVAKSYEGFSVNPFDQQKIFSDGSTTVKIYYTRNVYNVIFNANGGSYVETKIVKYEENATLPATPTKDGYVFVGWYTSFDNGITLDTKFDFTSSITNDVILFAKWKLAERFVFVQGASINGAITAEGYKESEIFKEGAIVSIPNFYISDHEVTQAEYKSIMGTWPDKSVTEEMKGVGDSHPAYYVNWFDTLVYCNKRSIKEDLTPCYTINESTNPDEWGDVPDSENHENFETWFNASCNFQADGYRLPTDAEWEYAARGGNELKGFQYQYAGSNSIDMVAWCSENSSETSHEVKLKQPNELGLYDMSGNLWEWCWDDSASDNLIYHRKNRGGNWYDGTDECMLSYRNNYYSYDRMSNIGFRLVRTATSQSQGDVYSQGISLNGKIYDKTSEVIVVPKGTVAKIEMEDDSSWNTYYEGDDASLKGVFLNGRKVQLSPFAMSKFEVTQELYQTVIGWNPSNFKTDVAAGEVQELRPVECITWYDAVNFCNELTKLTMGENHCVYTITSISYDETNSYITDATVSLDLSKKGYRLPTEAEWEFAARGGNPESDVWEYAYAGVQKTTDPFEIIEGKEATVDLILENYSWELNNSADNTHEVGKKLPNTLNIYDMVGNVKELCNDWFSENISLENVENPIGADYGTVKIEKGGSYLSTLWWCVISIRDETLPTTREKDLGFRVVRTITE